MIAKFIPEKIKILVFDVDDTITRGTLGIKLQAWKDLFADCLDTLQEARELYEFTGKGDRYNMIAHIVGESQEDCRKNKKVIEWASKFEKMSLAKIREEGIQSGDLTALVQLQDNFTGPVYLLSATPLEAVVGNIQYFENIYPEIKGMFTEIIGMPMNDGKTGELKQIASDNNISNDSLLMVGDGGSDYSGAVGAGTQFVGIVPEGKKDKWPGESFPKIPNIAELPKLLGI